MNNLKTVGFSEKALQLIERRRGDRSIDQYLNLILENISDKASLQQVPAGGANLLDILESRIQADIINLQANNGANPTGKILEVIKLMRVTHSGKIPYDLFYQECIARGVSIEDIEATVQKERGLFLIPVNKDDEYAKLLVLTIYTYLKDIYGSNLPTAQFYGKCLEEGLTVDNIRFAESTGQISIPDLTKLRKLAAKTDAMGIENKLLKLLYMLKNEFPQTIPTAILHVKCIQFGVTKEDVGQLEKTYTRYLLSKHNESISSEKIEVKSRIKAINTKVKLVLDDLVVSYGENVPAVAFIDKCKALGLTGEELAYARKMFDEYLATLASYKSIKQMNNKAYIILTSLHKSYSGKIPYNIFYTKCKAIGMKNEEIAEAIKQSGHMISAEKSNEEHYLKVLEDILVEQKKVGN